MVTAVMDTPHTNDRFAAFRVREVAIGFWSSLDDIYHLIVAKKKSAANSGQIKLTRLPEEAPTPLVIGHEASECQRARDAGEQHVRLGFAVLFRRTGHQLCEPLNAPTHRSLEGSPRPARMPHQLRSEGRNRTPVGDIVAVFGVEIPFDERRQLLFRRSALDCGSYSLVGFLKRELERFEEKLLLAGKMPIEAAVRETKVAHQRCDARPLAALLSKPLRGCADDSLPRLLFVFGWISHRIAF